jgi:sporulation protein YlmC with PRC-barrel domain
MTSLALRPVPRGVRRRLPALRRKRPVRTDVELISVAGLVGSRVYDDAWAPVGRVDDLVVRWDPSEPHPPLEAAVVKTLHGRTFVRADEIAEFRADELVLAGPLEQRRVERQPWLVALAHDVLDRQIVDVDGSDVARVSDLVLGRFVDGLRLVGSDISVRTLLRRVGPAFLRRKVATDRVYDCASVGAFSERGASEADSVLRLTDAAQRLRERGHADVASLLAELPADEQDGLAARVDAEHGS